MYLRALPPNGRGSWGIYTPTYISSWLRTVPKDIHPLELLVDFVEQSGFPGFGEPPKTLRQRDSDSSHEKLGQYKHKY